MNNRPKNPIKKSILLFFITLFLTIPTYATWSIIAVDRTTGHIGIAGASCTFDVSGIASIIPGKGAIVVQAASSYFARMKGVDLMVANATVEEILEAMKNEEFQPERQQYGVISLAENSFPLVYSGSEIKDWNGSKTANDVAVLGNILVNKSVITSAFNSFNEANDRPFAERLMLALKAGEKVGGDKRCGAQAARSAFISVYEPETKAIFKLAVQGLEKGGHPAVTLLEQKFDRTYGQTTASRKNSESEIIRSLNGSQVATSKLDEFIKQQMDSLNIPGLSIAFVNNDKTVYHKFYGIKNTETQERVTQNTLFDAASTSKTVFGFFVMKMVDEGLLDLDTPLYRYLEYPDIAHDERYKKITARMVLSHTSGFPNWRFLDKDGNYDPNAKLRIDFEPGTQFQYSGEGYDYLAKVIAHLKGIEKNQLQDIIENEVFDPLQMAHSSFVWNDYLEKHRAHGHLKGKPHKGWSNDEKSPDFNPAASLQTNAQEFANFLKALINNNIISENSLNEMLKVQSIAPATANSDKKQYGLGIIIEPNDYGTLYMHGGDNLSATAQFVFNQEHKSGYVFFTNSEHKKTLQKNLMQFFAAY